MNGATRSLSPGLRLTAKDEAKLRAIQSMAGIACAVCGEATDALVRLRMRTLPAAIFAPLCDDHRPRPDASEYELDRLEEMLISRSDALAL